MNQHLCNNETNTSGLLQKLNISSSGRNLPNPSDRSNTAGYLRPLSPLLKESDNKLGLYIEDRFLNSGATTYSQNALQVPVERTILTTNYQSKEFRCTGNVSCNQTKVKVSPLVSPSSQIYIPENAHVSQSFNVSPIQENFVSTENYNCSMTNSNIPQNYITDNSLNYHETSSASLPLSFCSGKLPSIEVNGHRNIYDHTLTTNNMPLPPMEQYMNSLDYLNETEDINYQYPDYLGNEAYLSKETVEVLGPEEVRWFYKSEGDKKWTPFIGYDSIKIEWAYRHLLHKTVTNDASPIDCNFKSDVSYKLIEKNNTDRPVVYGGLYEVDVSLLKGYSIYWKGEEFQIMRGTWFYEGSWLPVETNIAKQIEAEHLAQFQGTTVTTSICEKDSQQVIHTLALNEGEIDWFSAVDVFFSHDATPSRLMRSVSKKLGFQKTGYKLHRGYCLDASSDDKPPDITHIVFVVHGIGQKMETGRIIKNCTSLRENLKWLKEKQFAGCDFGQQTIEFFPVEWRSNLTLDAGLIESITPHKIIGLRQMLNASFMDIMYYNSSQYREEIVNGLACELDRLYTMFTARNPYFEANGGKVSVIAHSLGCVITYDIVTGWCPAPQMSQNFLQALISLTQQKDARAEGEPTLRSFQNALHVVLQEQLEKSSQPRLKFKIENFFCLGSPLSVFLGLRQKPHDANISLNDQYFPERSFRRLFNIFHPADPVAYRIEPLLCPKFSLVSPVTIHSYSSTDKTSYDEMTPELLSKSSSSKSDTPPDQLENETLSSQLPTTPSKGSTSWNFLNFIKQPKKGVETCSQNVSVEDIMLRGLNWKEDWF
ncbi:Phospholipase DDHD1 [Armadillidium vulgare]|nr:Phospholipase DDHD1 [Armadillidium vulgare]